MKQLTRISLSKYFFASATALLFITTGCNSDSKKEGDATTVGTDTATPPTDMTTTPVPTTTTGDTTGRMQPNPAKKGGKGKVSVAEQKANTNKNTTNTMDNTGVYSSADIMPAYPGGYNSMSDFFSSNVEYPQDATDNGIEGTVEVNFAVDETGKLSNAKVISPKIGYGVEEEALRVINKMPTWNPGKIKGKNVKTYYTLPVTFQLN